MSISTSTVWEVRTTGSDANGGFFNTASAGTDYSQQDSAQLSLTDVVTNGTTTVTSVTGGFTAAMVGNGINIAGTVYEITARASGTSITVDRTASAASGQTGKVGGACASPGYVAGQISSNASGFTTVWQKAGTYNIGNGTANTAGNSAKLNVGGAMGKWCGYNTARWSLSTGPTASDLSNKPLWQLTAALSNAPMLWLNAVGITVWNLNIDGGSLSGNYYGIRNTNYASVTACKIANVHGYGILEDNQLVVSDCEFFNIVGIGMGGGLAVNCRFHSCQTGYLLALASMLVGCVFDGNVAGVNGQSDLFIIDRCTFYNNTNGIAFTPFLESPVVRNCIFYGNSGYGISTSSSTDGIILDNNAFGSNTSGDVQNTITGVTRNSITLTADPFTNKAGGDFTLNNTAGGGAACRGAGLGSIAGATGTGYPDAGAYQHQDSGGGLIINSSMNGGLT